MNRTILSRVSAGEPSALERLIQELQALPRFAVEVASREHWQHLGPVYSYYPQEQAHAEGPFVRWADVEAALRASQGSAPSHSDAKENL